MPRDEETYEDVQVEIVQESTRALAAKLPDGRKVWIPKSALDLDSRALVKVGTACTLSIATWFVEKEELI
jgi:hypothetical protein